MTSPAKHALKLEHDNDAFSSNRHLALDSCFVACPDAKPVPTFAGRALERDDLILNILH
jgi:hypothetical protein